MQGQGRYPSTSCIRRLLGMKMQSSKELQQMTIDGKYGYFLNLHRRFSSLGGKFEAGIIADWCEDNGYFAIAHNYRRFMVDKHEREPIR